MRYTILLISAALVYGCEPESYESDTSSPTYDVVESLPVELVLTPGSLNGNDQFVSMELPLEVTESYDLVPLQVGAIISDLNGHSPDFLRIEFSSNRVEWVGYSQSSIEIYDTESDCLDNQEFCEEVIVGEGKSGYFEISDGYIGIQNAYCRFADDSYQFTITATVYDLAYWPVEQISEPVDILISCEMMNE